MVWFHFSKIEYVMKIANRKLDILRIKLAGTGSILNKVQVRIFYLVKYGKFLTNLIHRIQGESMHWKTSYIIDKFTEDLHIYSSLVSMTTLNSAQNTEPSKMGQIINTRFNVHNYFLTYKDRELLVKYNTL